MDHKKIAGGFLEIITSLTVNDRASPPFFWPYYGSRQGSWKEGEYFIQRQETPVTSSSHVWGSYFL